MAVIFSRLNMKRERITILTDLPLTSKHTPCLSNTHTHTHAQQLVRSTHTHTVTQVCVRVCLTPMPGRVQSDHINSLDPRYGGQMSVVLAAGHTARYRFIKHTDTLLIHTEEASQGENNIWPGKRVKLCKGHVTHKRERGENGNITLNQKNWGGEI